MRSVLVRLPVAVALLALAALLAGTLVAGP